jgi:hypothetical protein
MPDSEIVKSVVTSIEEDIRDGLGDALQFVDFQRDLEGSGLAPDDLVATASELVAVPWIYRCVHVGEFLGVPPTYVQLEIRGTTFVRATSTQSANWVYYRYIDFIGVLHQMGVSTTTRPALTPEQYDNWLANRPSS